MDPHIQIQAHIVARFFAHYKGCLYRYAYSDKVFFSLVFTFKNYKLSDLYHD